MLEPKKAWNLDKINYDKNSSCYDWVHLPLIITGGGGGGGGEEKEEEEEEEKEEEKR